MAMNFENATLKKEIDTLNQAMTQRVGPSEFIPHPAVVKQNSIIVIPESAPASKKFSFDVPAISEIRTATKQKIRKEKY